MEVHLPTELDAKLTRSAARHGRSGDEMAQDVLSRFFGEETRSAEAVERGEEALQQGEYLTREERSNP